MEPRVRPVWEPALFLGGEGAPPPREKFRITTERAVYLSVILHLILVLLFVISPPAKVRSQKLEDLPDPLGLIKLLKPEPREPPIPVQFFPAPGPASKAPGRHPLPSDLNRVAHGGEPKLPKAETPKALAQSGIRDLDPGRRGEKAQEAPPRASGSEEKSLRDLAAPRDAVTQPVRPRPLVGIPESALSGLSAEQAARAVKAHSGSGAGDEGGGYDREGGFVDSGPLSFDTAGYDWGFYAAEMIRKIKRNWDVPSLAHYGIKGYLTIRFFILADGRVEAEKILSTSGIPPYDNASFQAISHASPFRPLPADLGHDREGVTVTFFYNMRPEDVPGFAGSRR